MATKKKQLAETATQEKFALVNGVYLVYRDKTYRPFNADLSESFAKDVESIGIIYDGHAFRIALEDLGSWPLVRDTSKSPEWSPNYKTECQGLHDWDFEVATACIRLEGTVARLYNDLPSEHMGVCVDIFVLEDVPDQPALRYLHGIRCLAAGLFFSCRRFARDAAYYRKLAEGNASLARTTTVKIALGKLASVHSLEWWAHHVARLYGKYRLPNSEYISCPSGRQHYFGELYRREDFLPPVQAPFEGRAYYIPCHPEAYLERLYGNWKDLPAPEEREIHGYEELDLGVCGQS